LERDEWRLSRQSRHFAYQPGEEQAVCQLERSRPERAAALVVRALSAIRPVPSCFRVPVTQSFAGASRNR
jgi:hypothetical protein